MRFQILANESVRVHASEPLASFYQLSPFVWRQNDALHIMIRAVNHSERASEKVARIYHGRSLDGLNFYMDESPAIAPGSDSADHDGCEDPTVALVNENSTYTIPAGTKRSVVDLLCSQTEPSRHISINEESR